MIQEATKLLITCTFSIAAEASLAPYDEAPVIKLHETPLTMRYVIEDGNEAGTMIGDLGAVDVNVLWGTESVTLFEFTTFGTPTMTTIDFKRGKPLPAVHSRHTIIQGIIPSQYYGSCVVQ